MNRICLGDRVTGQRCGAITPNTRCERHATRIHGVNRPSSHARGYDREYQRNRKLLIGRPCIYCGKPSDTAEHVIPLALGGTSAMGNLAPACAHCNYALGARLRNRGVRARRR